MSQKEGNVSSPYYPRFFPPRKICMWKITAPKGKHIMLKVLDFEILECGYTCTCGYLQVAIGESASDSLSKKFCQNGLNVKGVDLRKPFYSIYNNIWLMFQSYNESFTNHPGFLVSYEQIDYTPPGKI
jgi:hypothetical protein